MAKKKKNELADKLEKKDSSKLQWFLFVIIIPLLFAMTIGLIVMTIAGVNVFEKAKDISGKIPGISKLTDAPTNQKSDEELEKKVVSLQAEIKDREAKIEQLQKKLDSSEQEVETLKVEKDRLEIEMKNLMNEKSQKTANNEGKQLTKTYESMSPKNIANILPNLSDQDAVQLLNGLSTDQQGKVLEKLPPETAAKYTKLLSNITS
ncbi:flagellar motility protein MotE (MotC chaperone) [Oikeobacillus pervagus]|uniref:Flagellar motility protein MotE (MotC chaperone) n=1 Tax=Oikeobacillus pervagus TaxID=1325931 RepID=A0AAJ1T1N0_9BACI|nr:MotE family protein [Oikeobacillus pervagus]MDQ0214299.1 flagellar motility protein MotE (MotC chaperone) [Oikeobacillus pervagus]